MARYGVHVGPVAGQGEHRNLSRLLIVEWDLPADDLEQNHCVRVYVCLFGVFPCMHLGGCPMQTPHRSCHSLPFGALILYACEAKVRDLNPRGVHRGSDRRDEQQIRRLQISVYDLMWHCVQVLHCSRDVPAHCQLLAPHKVYVATIVQKLVASAPLAKLGDDQELTVEMRNAENAYEVLMPRFFHHGHFPAESHLPLDVGAVHEADVHLLDRHELALENTAEHLGSSSRTNALLEFELRS
mmetsp:Transcript_25365/g.70563  ORF Transcript_25365/g.70563 Transcript_25365/m.70563 type:complete len:241 (-) Transcript_25365:198-920(-)